MKKIIIFILCLFTVMLSGCDLVEKFNEELEKGEKPYLSFVCVKDVKNIYGVNNEREVVKVTENANSNFGLFDIYNNYLYYTDSSFKLHKISIDETLKDENLNLEIDSKSWDLSVYNDKMIVQGLNKDWFTKIYDIKTKESNSLSIVVKNEDYFYKNYYYFTDNNQNLMAYDIETNKLNLVSEDSRIIFRRDNYILYSKRDKGIYLYDTETTMSKMVLEDNEYENISYDVVIDNNKIAYFIKNNKFMKLNNSEITKISDMNESKAFEAEYKLYMLDDNTILISEEDFEEDNCDLGCYDGKNVYYYYDINKDKLIKADKDYNDLKYCDNVVYYKK